MDGLSEQCIVEMKSIFDADQGALSGYLDSDQIKKCISELNKRYSHKYQEATDAEIEAFISYYTGSGGPRRSINFSEFLYLMAKRTKDQNENSNLRAAFNEFDVDDNGYVNTMELRGVLGKLGHGRMSDVEIDSLIREGDLNQDGVLDFEEFKRIMTSPKAHNYWSERDLK